MKYPMYAIQEAESPLDWLCADALGRLLCGERIGCAADIEDRALFDSHKVAKRVADKINDEPTEYVRVIVVRYPGDEGVPLSEF